MEETKYLIFLDSINRTILGEIGLDTDTTIEIINPVTINLTPGNDGKINLQAFPLFPRELMEGINRDSVFYYNKENITITNVQVEKKLIDHYKMMFREIEIKKEEKEEKEPLKLFEKE